MTEIDYINGRKTQYIYGISKYNREIRKRQIEFNFNDIEYSLKTSNSMVDGFVKRMIYPLYIYHKSRDQNIKHITSQDLSFILNILPLNPSIITCFDIIPWTFYKKRTVYWKMNLKGLKKANIIVTISNYVKKELLSTIKIPEDKIHVIYCGVDQNFFKKNPEYSNYRRDYGFSSSDKIVLYLGSEERRKNLSVILSALKSLNNNFPTIKFLKVGRAYPGSRVETLNLIKHHGLQNKVRFIDYVPENQLPIIYNIADVFVFPSLSEGFGLPPLEAMACGTPVICSNTTSLPEITGNAALLVNPNDSKQLKNAIYHILTNKTLQKELSEKGQTRAKYFNWEKSAREMSKIYIELESLI